MADASERPTRTVLAVDGNSLVHRAYHALAGAAGSPTARTDDGQPAWAVRGLLTQLVAAVERIEPDVVVVGFDDPASSLRRQRWPQYKANRAAKADALVSQLRLASETLRDLGVAVVIPEGLEADDVLASTARQAGDGGAATVLVTSDRDAFALIDERTSVLRIINGGVLASPMLTPARLVTLLGVRPDQYRDFAALRGDPADNLPGVRGIGAKTAARLLAALGSARAVFDDAATGGARVRAAAGAGVARRLTDPAARDAWELACQVMTMRADLPLGVDFAAAAGSAAGVDQGAGPGALPLDAEAVRAVYTRFRLPSTTRAALAVLAQQRDGAPPRPPTLQGFACAEQPLPQDRRPVSIRTVPRSSQLALF
ncbi:MAG: flap endonuclease [Actinomycetia bacterium]|nr:flap endonuclease [Actinomycetes bacterium]